jgi:tRNA G18 (ribose-2'-O)-methylase SpoU
VSALILDDVDDARLEPFRHIGDHRWLTAQGLFVIEGRLVVARLLASPHHVRAVLVTASAHEALRPALAAHSDHPPVYVVPKGWMEQLTGFNLHRGCLAVADRPAARSVDDLLKTRPQRLLVLERIGNPDNIGALFRNALAFGIDGIVLGPDCGDPLYRKAVRVSCGASLVMPFAVAMEWPGILQDLRSAGISVLAMTPSREAIAINEFASTKARGARIALLLGAEGEGLSSAAQALADARVRIPIAAEADSLNVAVAAGIALHALGPPSSSQ